MADLSPAVIAWITFASLIATSIIALTIANKSKDVIEDREKGAGLPPPMTPSTISDYKLKVIETPEPTPGGSSLRRVMTPYLEGHIFFPPDGNDDPHLHTSNKAR